MTAQNHFILSLSLRYVFIIIFLISINILSSHQWHQQQRGPHGRDIWWEWRTTLSPRSNTQHIFRDYRHYHLLFCFGPYGLFESHNNNDKQCRQKNWDIICCCNRWESSVVSVGTFLLVITQHVILPLNTYYHVKPHLQITPSIHPLLTHPIFNPLLTLTL